MFVCAFVINTISSRHLVASLLIVAFVMSLKTTETINSLWLIVDMVKCLQENEIFVVKMV